MVRIFIWTFVILNCEVIAKKLDYNLNIKNDTKDLAKAELKDIELEIEGKYFCKAKLKKINAFSDNFIFGENITMQIELQPKKFVHIEMQEAMIIQDDLEYFFEINSLTKLKYLDITLNIEEILANTKSKTINLKKCSGEYKDFKFYTNKTVKIKEEVAKAFNIFGTSQNWKFFAKSMNLTLDKIVIYEVVVNSFNQDMKISINNIILEKTNNIAQNIKLSFKTKNNQMIEVNTKDAYFENENMITFPSIININLGGVELIAENAKKIDHKIMLNKIYLKNDKSKMISKKAYIDLSSRKFCLEDGSVEW